MFISQFILTKKNYKMQFNIPPRVFPSTTMHINYQID